RDVPRAVERRQPGHRPRQRDLLHVHHADDPRRCRHWRRYRRVGGPARRVRLRPARRRPLDRGHLALAGSPHPGHDDDRRAGAARRRSAPHGVAVARHPRNTLNELTGEEWLYFTKSVWTTAYPSELGHALRKAHGANKPPRLMARLIEFFTRTGELVLDPFAGVGGTLLGAAIARGPRRALGIELAPRWAEVYQRVVSELKGENDGRGPVLADLGPNDPGGPRGFDPSGCELRVGDALAILPTLDAGAVDCGATDPPHNGQLPIL